MGGPFLLGASRTMSGKSMDELETTGRLWLRGCLNERQMAPFDRGFGAKGRPGARLDAGATAPGMLGPATPLTRRISQILVGAQPVSVVAFDKTPDSNWGVPWHQDRVIAVAQRHDLPGFGNWSRKAGIWHCEPPANILDQMLFVRVHLDDTDSDNGAMEIALGSHRKGLVPADQAQDTAEALPTEVCLAKRGDVLILKMLVLHRSLPSKRPSSRRTIRVDYAAQPLPPPLSWTRGPLE